MLVQESLAVGDRTVSVVFCVCKIYSVFLMSFHALKVQRVFRKFRTAKGKEQLEISKKIFSFSKLYKKWYQSCDNFRSRDPSLDFSFLNYPNFVTIFCRVLKMKIFFLNIPSYPSPLAVRNSLINQFYQETLSFWIFSTTKKKYKTDIQKSVPKTCRFLSFENIQKPNFFVILKQIYLFT